MKKPLAIAALIAALAAEPLAAAPAADSNPRSITTTGTVNVTIPADFARLSVSLSTLDADLQASNRRLDDALAALRAELKTRGIPEKAVVLKNRDVRKSWDHAYQRERTFLGYAASAQVVISIDDIAKLSPLITYLGLHEEYGSWNPELRSSRTGAEKNAVLALALRTARNKAEILAKEGGAKLGPLLNATEEEVQAGSYRDNPSTNAQQSVTAPSPGADNDDANSPTPPGNHVISINVRIRATFALE